MILEIDADMQLALADALFSLFDQYLETHVLDYECPITAASFLDMVADLFDAVKQRVKNAPMRKELTRPRSISSERGENLIRRCAPFIDGVLEVNNTTPVVADQALLVRSSKRLRDLLDFPRQDFIDTNYLAKLKLLLPTLPNHPQSLEEDLCQQGDILGAHFAQRPEDSPVPAMMAMWTRSLMLASTDSLSEVEGRNFWGLTRHQKPPQDSETRLSAVSSIKRFMKSFSVAGGRLQDTPQFLQIWLILCDLLVDDDEDVRMQAAELTCTMLHKSAQQKGSVKQPWMVSPPATKGRLLDYLAQSYSRSHRFWAESVARMTGRLSKVGLQSRVGAPDRWEDILFAGYKEAIRFFRPLDGFRKSRSWSQPVFEEENHNLYLDPVREADLWKEAASRLILPECNEGHSIDQTRLIWIFALAALLEALAQIRELIEVDGEIRKDSPLGYTSAPEAFSAIFAIICLQKLCSQCMRDVSNPQKIHGRLERILLEQLLHSYGRDERDDGTWLQERRLRATDSRLHELLASKLDDSHQNLDSHVIEEAICEKISRLPASM